ncbi:MAG: hypothetical protein JSR68_13790 [Proteobacteria bacterium]|nr:hypothetical protein [Pseudomonadota bacterium]
MTAQRPPSPWRLPVTLVLALTLSPLAIVAWVCLSGDQRAVYWRSRGVRGGLWVAVGAALPLLFVSAAAALGLWPDPNPNPVGLGLLFAAGLALGSMLAVLGMVWTHVRR